MTFEVKVIKAEGDLLLEDLARSTKPEYLFGIHKCNKDLFRYVKLKNQPPIGIFPATTTCASLDPKIVKISNPAPQLQAVINDYLDFIKQKPNYACQKLLIPVIDHFYSGGEKKTFTGLLEIKIVNKTFSINFYDPCSEDIDKTLAIQSHFNKDQYKSIAEYQENAFKEFQKGILQQVISSLYPAFELTSDETDRKVIKIVYLSLYDPDVDSNKYNYVISFIKSILHHGNLDAEKIKKVLNEKKKRNSVFIPHSPIQHGNVSEARSFISDAADLQKSNLGQHEASEAPVVRTLRRQMQSAYHDGFDKPKDEYKIPVNDMVYESAKLSSHIAGYKQPPIVPSYLPMEKPIDTAAMNTQKPIQTGVIQQAGQFIKNHRAAIILTAAWLLFSSALLIGLVFPPVFLTNLFGTGILGAHGIIATHLLLGGLNTLQLALAITGIDIAFFIISVGFALVITNIFTQQTTDSNNAKNPGIELKPFTKSPDDHDAQIALLNTKKTPDHQATGCSFWRLLGSHYCFAKHQPAASMTAQPLTKNTL